MFITETQTLEFWLRMQTRLTAEFDAGRAKLAEYREMTFDADIDSADLLLSRIETLRAEAQRVLVDAENLRLLRVVLARQIGAAWFEAGLPTKEAYLAALRDIGALFVDSVCNLPPRTPGELDLADYQRRFEALRQAGNGETVVADRQKLRAQSVTLRVLGKEDGINHESMVRSIETLIDQTSTDIQHVKASTRFSLEVPDETMYLLQQHGVRAQQLGAGPAGQHADGQAHAPANSSVPENAQPSDEPIENSESEPQAAVRAQAAPRALPASDGQQTPEALAKPSDAGAA